MHGIQTVSIYVLSIISRFPNSCTVISLIFSLGNQLEFWQNASEIIPPFHKKVIRVPLGKQIAPQKSRRFLLQKTSP